MQHKQQIMSALIKALTVSIQHINTEPAAQRGFLFAMTICLSVIYPGKLLLQGLISMDHVSSLSKLKQTDVPFHKQK